MAPIQGTCAGTTITCGRCPDGDKTTILLKGEPKSVSMCHCGECRTRNCSVGGAFATFDRNDVEIQTLNALATDHDKQNDAPLTHVLCKCLDVALFHTNDFETDQELHVNAGMICNALVGHDTPMKEGCHVMENDPFFFGAFFDKSTLQHLHYETRIMDWKQDEARTTSKQELPKTAIKAIEAKEYPFECWCGHTKGIVNGDRLAATICTCSKCRSRTSTFDTSVIFPKGAVSYTTDVVQRSFGDNADHQAYCCGKCGTVIDLTLDSLQISVVNTSALLKGLLGKDNRPAHCDWGECRGCVHGPPSLVEDCMYMFYENRAINRHDDTPKWKDIPAPFGGSNVLLGPKGNPIPMEKNEEEAQTVSTEN